MPNCPKYACYCTIDRGHVPLLIKMTLVALGMSALIDIAVRSKGVVVSALLAFLSGSLEVSRKELISETWVDSVNGRVQLTQLNAKTPG
jgi:hypothetical protein